MRSPTGLRLAWASSVHPSQLNAWYAIDKNVKAPGMVNIFHSDNSKNEIHPWFAVDLLEPNVITEVAIVERKDGWTD